MQKVLFSEIVQTTKQYMRCVTNVTHFESAAMEMDHSL
jgi:hypothetical protein